MTEAKRDRREDYPSEHEDYASRRDDYASKRDERAREYGGDVDDYGDGRHKKHAGSKCTVKRNSSACNPDAIFVAGKAAEKTKDDTACTKCGGGDYKKTPTECAPKRTTCPPGEYVDIPPYLWSESSL